MSKCYPPASLGRYGNCAVIYGIRPLIFPKIIIIIKILKVKISLYNSISFFDVIRCQSAWCCYFDIVASLVFKTP